MTTKQSLTITACIVAVLSVTALAIETLASKTISANVVIVVLDADKITPNQRRLAIDICRQPQVWCAIDIPENAIQELNALAREVNQTGLRTQGEKSGTWR